MSSLKISLCLPFGWLLFSVLVLCAVGLPWDFDPDASDPYDDENDDRAVAFNTRSSPVIEPLKIKNKDQFIDLSQSNQCGQSKSGIVPKDPNLNSTYQSEYGAFPWMTAIFNNSRFIAAGTLIRMDVVLTSRDSIESIPKEKLQVVAGAWDLRGSGEKFSKLNRSVIDVSVWESVAIIFLTTPFLKVPSIQTICLPQPGAVFTEIDCQTIGWSQPSDTATSQSDILWFRKNVVMPREDCESLIDIQDNRTQEPGFFCAVDASNEFSPLNIGAGLFCRSKISSPAVMAGLALTSRGWSLDNRPSLFADIPHYVEWIQRELTDDETPEIKLHDQK
ncbi:phenoloxidase-activating factor 2-like [Drosophila obscura]|uniref:phenoloxidase-activating factor 2-like n=1 Tax=Drosophila obscura TaxID=7282 RepID=UPI001BB1C5BF|nr:phenoloxidase-activating factor 2-like [Drosophila obscura]